MGKGKLFVIEAGFIKDGQIVFSIWALYVFKYIRDKFKKESIEIEKKKFYRMEIYRIIAERSRFVNL